MLTAEQLLDRVKTTLLEDGTDGFWDDQEIVDYLNEGIKFVLTQQPSAYTIQDNIALVAGYKVFCVVDASGNWSKMATELTVARVVQAGAMPIDTFRLYINRQLAKTGAGRRP